MNRALNKNNGGNMLEQQKIIDQAMEGVTGLLHEYAKTTAIDDSAQKALLVFMRATLSASLANAMKESELHRHINTEMRQGLQHIYKTITSVAKPASECASQEDTGKLFCEATEQLNEVMATTLEATENIMEQVESLQDRLIETSGHLKTIQKEHETDAVNTLIEQVAAFEDSLTQIMTALSFQDLTGQRLKKVVTALGEIQDSIFDMYVSSGLMLKTSEEMPEKEIEEIAAESKRRMDEIKEVKGSELKGPSRDASQAAVDSLLADLGL
ncbi:MAG: hypothetical protein DELT_01882 [Desulfovibrio sp.]